MFCQMNDVYIQTVTSLHSKPLSAVIASFITVAFSSHEFKLHLFHLFICSYVATRNKAVVICNLPDISNCQWSKDTGYFAT